MLIIFILVIVLFLYLIRKRLLEFLKQVKKHEKDAWIWLVEYLTVYILPFFIFTIIFQLTEDKASYWDRMKALPNWMLIGIILFGDSLKELIEFLWKTKGRFDENIKISLSIGLFGISMCAVFLAVLIFDHQSKDTTQLIGLFYFWQVSLFVASSIYSFVMKILVADAVININRNDSSSPEI